MWKSDKTAPAHSNVLQNFSMRDPDKLVSILKDVFSNMRCKRSKGVNDI